jgi:hypothetical protein
VAVELVSIAIVLTIQKHGTRVAVVGLGRVVVLRRTWLLTAGPIAVATLLAFEIWIRTAHGISYFATNFLSLMAASARLARRSWS